MKKHKSMFLLLEIFLLLVVLYFVMSQVNKKQAEKENKETIMVTNLSNVVSLEYTDGEDTISFVKEEGVWYAADNKELNLDSELVQEMVDELSRIAAVRKLEGADEPEAYGLDNPLYTITLEDAEEETTE